MPIEIVLFEKYKEGTSIGFTISPLCEDVVDEKGNVTGRTKCLPHSSSPEKLKEMFESAQSVLSQHGFQIEIFGTLSAMQKSLQKKTGYVMHSDEAVIEFTRETISGISVITKPTLSERLKFWKEKYYADGGK